ncbi:porin family protein [Sphingomonas sp. BK235]|uniref:outer membrane beta-barrel protein n=1 Tax=Sphingomonas sp. BK235 TaxID=2512131 RepID=UPI001042EF0A|nr:porin family protein [Sphingomonas sp. BK235]TCP30109.1 outer membrane immunogenic protein [Sphingomonas sp. BK235]
MFHVLRVLFFIALACGSNAHAHAQSFSGPHVEAIAGLSHDKREVLDRSLKDDSLLYGTGGGYDLRTGNVVVGVVGEVSGTTNKNCGTFDLAATSGTPSLAGRVCEKGQRALFAGARLGYVLGERTLGYVLGGYENIRTRTTFDGAIDGVDAPARSHRTEDGFRVGAGLERAINDHAFIKAEYRYARSGSGGPSSERHQIVSGVGIRF